MSLLDKIKNQLLAEMSRRNIDVVTAFAKDKPEAISALVSLLLYNDTKIAPRAAWALEKISEENKGCLDAYLPQLVPFLPTITYSGTKRCTTKILMHHSVPEEFQGEVLDFCLSTIESPKEPVAVKANCMSIAFSLLPHYPELKNELLSVIENQIENNSMALKARLKVLKHNYKI